MSCLKDSWNERNFREARGADQGQTLHEGSRSAAAIANSETERTATRQSAGIFAILRKSDDTMKSFRAAKTASCWSHFADFWRGCQLYILSFDHLGRKSSLSSFARMRQTRIIKPPAWTRSVWSLPWCGARGKDPGRLQHKAPQSARHGFTHEHLLTRTRERLEFLAFYKVRSAHCCSLTRHNPAL